MYLGITQSMLIYFVRIPTMYSAWIGTDASSKPRDSDILPQWCAMCSFGTCRWWPVIHSGPDQWLNNLEFHRCSFDLRCLVVMSRVSINNRCIATSMFKPSASKEHYDKSFGQNVKARVQRVAIKYGQRFCSRDNEQDDPLVNVNKKLWKDPPCYLAG